jgi:hypothetical protein
MIPKIGYNTIGSKAVTAIGIASEIHHTAISAVMAAMRFAAGGMSSGEIKKTIKKNRSKPDPKPP